MASGVGEGVAVGGTGVGEDVTVLISHSSPVNFSEFGSIVSPSFVQKAYKRAAK
jgi:hypothetical protein